MENSKLDRSLCSDILATEHSVTVSSVTNIILALFKNTNSYNNCVCGSKCMYMYVPKLLTNLDIIAMDSRISWYKHDAGVIHPVFHSFQCPGSAHVSYMYVRNIHTRETAFQDCMTSNCVCHLFSKPNPTSVTLLGH